LNEVASSSVSSTATNPEKSVIDVIARPTLSRSN
jgi:hypothetical protein